MEINMPTVNFDNIRDIDDGDPLPEGWYECCVVKVSESSTKAGDEMWIVDFEVIEGPHKGRKIFDTLNFSQAALPRIKFFFGELGLDVSGTRSVTLDDIKDASLAVRVTIEESTDSGQRRRRNVVPFLGFAETRAQKNSSLVNAPIHEPDQDEKDCPF